MNFSSRILLRKFDIFRTINTNREVSEREIIVEHDITIGNRNCDYRIYRLIE